MTNKEDYIKVTTPVLIPGVPNSNYQNEEQPLTPKEIKHIMKLLHEIPDHVGFTVSLTDFTCLDGSVFAKNCLTASQNIEEEKISNKLLF